MEKEEANWKLRLRHGKLETPFAHFTLLAPGVASNISEGFECPDGNAIMAMKVWAETPEISAEIFQDIASQIGFTLTGNIQIFNSAPDEPPKENPSAYNINFTPFNND